MTETGEENTQDSLDRVLWPETMAFSMYAKKEPVKVRRRVSIPHSLCPFSIIYIMMSKLRRQGFRTHRSFNELTTNASKSL